MSEDDRAAKAARAKAMLKKRQAKKSGTPSSHTPGITSPVSERAFSPAPPEPVSEAPLDEQKRDLSDVFTSGDATDASWLNTLPRAGSPPPAPPPTAIVFTDSAVTSPNSATIVSANGHRSQGEISWLKENDTSSAQIEQLSKEQAELQNIIDSLKAQNETLATELRKSESLNVSAQAEKRTLKLELEQSEKAKSDLTSHHALVNAEVDTLRVNLTQAEALKSNLQRAEANLIAENKNMKTTLAELEAEKAKLSRSEAALKADYEHLKSDLTGTLNATISKLEQTELALDKQRGHSSELEQQLQQLQTEFEISLRNEQQTISLLVSEKASLTSDLERLSGAESHAQEAERLLSEEQMKTTNLEDHLQQLRSELQEYTVRLQNQEHTERELTDKAKDQERQLQIANGSLITIRKEAEKHRRRVRELEEQIQSDDRVERLEASVKNTQDRADDLEFQLSKLKQSHSALKSERDLQDSRIQSFIEQEEEWKTKHTNLQASHQNVEAQLAKRIAEREEISNEKTTLRTELDTAQKALLLLQGELTNAANELAASSKQLQTVQNEAKIAHRRAEDAERTQRELQEEGTNLMHSLNEMRPKIVELTGIKLELTEKASELENVIQSQENTIGQLELSLEEARTDLEASEKRLQDLLSEREKERIFTQDNNSELQLAYSQLQAELDEALAKARSLEAEHAARQTEAIQQAEEIARLQELASVQSEELASLQHEIYQRQDDQSEDKSFLDVAQNEIEALRSEIALKDEELERLRLRTSISSAFPDKPHSLKDELNDEVLASLKLELSSSQSHVRSLEESLYDAEARSHALMKQVAALEDQLAGYQTDPKRTFSPLAGALPSRPSSRAQSIAGSHPTKPSALARSAIEHNLSPETRHKRKTSLTMLKARIESELAAASAHSQNARPLSPVQSESSLGQGSNTGSIYPHHKHRLQFMDDSHVFWCSSCRGDLVIL